MGGRGARRGGFSRREVLKLGAAAAGAALGGAFGGRAFADGGFTLPVSPRFVPFQVAMPVPGHAEPKEPGGSVFELHMKKGWTEIIPGVPTEIWGYDGRYPGPTLHGECNKQMTVRFYNHLEVETSVHYHSGHTFSDSDGHPNILIEPPSPKPGGGVEVHYKDYVYPLRDPGGDPNERTTTGWYHDHALDITAETVLHGLAGFFLTTDEVEQDHIHYGRIPGTELGAADGGIPRDVPIVIQDRRFLDTGELFFNPFDHDGFLGDVYVVNGKAQPYFKVQRRRYRLRLLNGCNARFLELRLSSGSFLRIGYDGWLLPYAVKQDTIFASPATRADVIVDFRYAPDVVYLENICDQDEGRGPGGDSDRPDRLDRGVPLLKFVVEGPTQPDDGKLAPGDLVRRNTPIDPAEITVTRRFEFERRQGAWVINDRFFDPKRYDATPRLGGAERWIIKNGGGGWWHPIHIHLESHQLQRFNGRRVARPFKQDTTILGPGDEAELFMRFRDYDGPFVFHCHNIEHEDMRMMGQFYVKGP